MAKKTTTNNSKNDINDLNESIQEMSKHFGVYNDSMLELLKMKKEELDAQKKITEEQKKTTEEQKRQNTQLKTTKQHLKDIYNENLKNVFSVTELFKHLQAADFQTKKLAVSMGLNQTLTSSMTKNIREASVYAAQLGVSYEELIAMQKAFSEYTGTASLLTTNTLKEISELAKNSGVAGEEFATAIGRMDKIGLSAQKTTAIMRGIINSSQSMGLNATVVTKKVVDNMDKLNKYRFQNGIEGLQKMAELSAKTRISMEASFNAIDKFNTLEGTIENTARLFAMGGEFAKADAFQLGFLSRNKPEEFQKQISSMLKGLATQNENGIFDISAADIDRIKAVAEITGVSSDQLQEAAKTLAKNSAIGMQLTGMKKEDIEIISNLAKSNGKNKFTVAIDGKDIDVTKIGTEELARLKKQETDFKANAIRQQNAIELFNNQINTLRNLMLPILDGINWYLTKVIQASDYIKEAVGGKSGEAFGSVNTIVAMLAPLAALKLGGGLIGSLGSVLSGKMGGWFSKDSAKGLKDTGDALNGIPSQSKLSGMASGLMGLGVAAAGIGGGIWMASKGISELGKSFENQSGWKSVGIIGTALVGFGGAVALAGSVASVGVGPLLALSAAAVGVGYGVNLASQGISGLISSTSDALKNLSNVNNLGSSMLALSGSLLAFSNPLAMLGVANLGLVASTLSSNMGGFNSASNMFGNLSNFLSKPSDNLDKLRNTIESLKNLDTTNGFTTAVNNLEKVFSKPIKVEFANKEVNITTKVDLYIDKEKLATTLNISKRNVVETLKARNGRG